MKQSERLRASLAIASLLMPASALADSGTNVGTISVKGPALGEGMMVQEDSAKARSTITKDAMDKMPATANAIDRLKFTPGLNVTSTDASGLSGVDFTMRGMKADQVGLSMDGIPINDSGNYAVYPNLLGDSENIQEVFVTQGASEADGPHIGSSGGNIGLVSRRPAKTFGGFVKQSVGSNNLQKTFVRLDTGEHKGLSNWISYSHTEADKWRGKGSLNSEKFEMNTLFNEGDGNSSNLVMRYNRQNNYNYHTLSKAEFDKSGRYTDFATDPVFNSKGQLTNNYYRISRNPFQNVTLTFTQKVQLRDNLQLTVQPYYYWGNGGSTAATPYTLGRTSSKAGQYDLSHQGTNGYYRPSWTQTWRPGVTTKLKWDINEQHSVEGGYWYERARQRQTQPYVALKADGSPAQLWGAPGDADQVTDANGKTVQGRNQYTVTPAQKVWVQDTWYATPKWTLTGGLAYQYVERKGERYGSLTERPDSKHASYRKVLPSVSARYSLSPRTQLFYNLTRNMRTPPNYVLYNAGDSISTKPELSWSNELGWRFQRDDMLMSATLFSMRYSDRQLSTTNPDGEFEMLNIGKVENNGLELEWSGKLPHDFNFYTSYTYTDSQQKSDVISGGQQLPTTGKEVPNVPNHMLNMTLGYDDGRYYSSVTGKYVSRYYGDLTNDEKVKGHAVVDVAAGVHLPVNNTYIKSAALRVGIDNLFDQQYLSSAQTPALNAASYGRAKAKTPYYSVGEERTLSLSLEASF